MKSIAPGSSHDAKRMVGLTLIEVNVRVQSVDFVLLNGDTWGSLQIWKKFTYTLPDGTEGYFDPAVIYKPGDGFSGNFVLLRGTICSDIHLDESGMVVRFETLGEISLDFEEFDFDPLQIWGWDGPNRDVLVFWHVV